MLLYIHRNGQRLGPYSPDDVRSSLAAGSVCPNDLAWHEGALDWLPLASIPGFGNDMPPVSPRQIIPPPPSTPSPTSGLAIASLVFGITGLGTGLTAIPAVVCGHLSLSKIKKAAGRLSGDGLAMAGLLLGYCGIGVLLLMIAMMHFAGVAAGIATPAFFDAFNTAARQARCYSHATQIANACKAYAKDHDGRFPESLTELVPKYVPDPGSLTCPLLKNDPSVGYEYFPGEATDPGTKVLLISKGETMLRNKLIVTYDGKVAEKTDQ